MSSFSTTCFVILLLAQLAHGQQSEKMTAGQIVDRAASVYSSCRTYSDHGEVSIDFVFNSFRRPRVQPFSTAFVRSTDFRFEFKMRRGAEEWDSFIAWKKDATEKSWWSFTQHDESVSKALGSFVKLSGGSAQTIPALLQPDLFSSPDILKSLKDPKLAGKDKIDGREAFRIEASFQEGKVRVWIDRQAFLILKVFHKEERPEGFSVETITTYDPVVNAEIGSDKLAFNPPSSQLLAPSRVKRDQKPRTGDEETSQNQQPKKTDSDTGKKQSKAIDNPDEVDVVRVDTTLVAMNVLAIDKDGRLVKGLSQNDFVVVEDGQPQPVTTFALGDDLARPRNIVLIIDYSGSQLPFIKTSVAAARTLVDKLNPNDRMQIVTDDVEVLADFTSDKDKLRTRLDSLLNGVSKGGRLGRSKQYSALVATLNKLTEKQNLRPIVIFQTDGDELSFLRPAPSYPPPFPMAPPPNEFIQASFSIVDVFATALRSEATIYSVIPGVRLLGLTPPQRVERAKRMVELSNLAWQRFRSDWKPRPQKTPPTDEEWLAQAEPFMWTQKALVTLADLSGGWANFLEEPEQAGDIYSRILADINARYIIGYQPANKERDGKLRFVKVEVRGHPEYRIWGRTSYYAPRPDR